MKCPACGTEGVYVGLTEVECKCVNCRHWKEEKTSDYITDDNLMRAFEAPFTNPCVEVGHLTLVFKLSGVFLKAVPS